MRWSFTIGPKYLPKGPPERLVQGPLSRCVQKVPRHWPKFCFAQSSHPHVCKGLTKLCVKGPLFPKSHRGFKGPPLRPLQAFCQSPPRTLANWLCQPTPTMCPRIVYKAAPMLPNPRYWTMPLLFAKGAHSSGLPEHLGS